MFETLQRHS